MVFNIQNRCGSGTNTMLNFRSQRGCGSRDIHTITESLPSLTSSSCFIVSQSHNGSHNLMPLEQVQWVTLMGAKLDTHVATLTPRQKCRPRESQQITTPNNPALPLECKGSVGQDMLLRGLSLALFFSCTHSLSSFILLFVRECKLHMASPPQHPPPNTTLRSTGPPLAPKLHDLDLEPTPPILRPCPRGTSSQLQGPKSKTLVLDHLLI
ncbi:hypothetical protein CRG98_011700 [Punica granatum]|uniref:Uncharacterized protein n=1 Tax=Punica granatum TaxID=22663 RepID=A0A2I0KHW6_PUNGR|nr:hypothetical protein CRG98_011700 [Punica granatum]